MTLNDKSSRDIAQLVRENEGRDYPPFTPYLPSEAPEMERHCKAEEPWIDRRAAFVFGLCIGCAFGLLAGWLV